MVILNNVYHLNLIRLLSKNGNLKLATLVI